MNKYLAAAVSAVALATVSAPAQAATDLGSFALTDLNSTADFFAQFSVFDENVAAGDYTIRYTFGFPQAGVGAGDVSASLVSGNNTVFSSVSLNGALFNLTNGNTLGAVTGAPVYAAPTSNVLTLNYTVLQNGIRSYNGSVSATAVPEPATWAMMLLGFGLVGFGLRRRPSTTRRVNYSMA